MAATKTNVTEIINVNVVRGRFYETFYTQKFIIRKFVDMKISRSTVHVSVIFISPD